MRRLRICQLITDLGPAGAERCVYELVRRLDRSRFDVQVAALRGGAVGDWLAEAGVATTVLGVRGKWDVWKLRKLVDLLRRERIDILHTHLFHADLAGRAAAYLADVPCLIHTIHTAEVRFRPWQFVWARLTAGRCERIIAVSLSARDHHAHRSGLPVGRYVVIPNGIDAAAYARDAASRRRFRKQWSVAPKDILVAFVGRLSHEKGVETLLRAMHILAVRGHAPKLFIAGDGPKRKLIEKFIATAPAGRHVRLLGFTGDVRGVLSAADVFAMPSRWEGFGLAAVEAMAAGLPVVATHVPGLKDVIVDGRTGLLIEKGDAGSLADSIERLCSDPALRKRLGQAGRRRASECFDIAATIAAHGALYTKAAEGFLGGSSPFGLRGRSSHHFL